jgi:hypothetical protein
LSKRTERRSETPTVTERPRVAKRNSELGVILADASYPLSIFRAYTGISNLVLRDAVRDGLRVVKLGHTKHVVGADWIAFLRSVPDPARREESD